MVSRLNKSPGEVREAVVHFELYRCLKNCISSEGRFEKIRFVDVIPEVPVNGRSADLVVKADLNGSPVNFLVIEVKKRTKEGFPIFDTASLDQTKGYAQTLSAVYQGITDGQRLRLFRTLDDRLLGNYKFSLNEGAARQLLKGLSDLQAGKASGLPFDVIQSPWPQIVKLSDEFSTMLNNLFNEISGKGGILAARRGRVVFLNIGSYEGILRLGLDKSPKEAYVHIQLDILRKMLEFAKYTQTIRKLSEISGFQWVKDRTDASKAFIWSPIASIIADEKPDYNQAKEDLREWLLELDGARAN